MLWSDDRAHLGTATKKGEDAGIGERPMLSYRMGGIAELRVGAHDDKMGKIKAARKGRVSMHGCFVVC